LFALLGCAAAMPDAPERHTPAAAEDIADALAFALRFQGRKRVHNAAKLRLTSFAYNDILGGRNSEKVVVAYEPRTLD
jgi:hypothetical protein